MPARNTVLATQETYHIFNRSLRGIPLFSNKREFSQFLEATEYYLQQSPPTKFSYFKKNKNRISFQMDNNQLVKIICYCIMPDHFHFALTQLTEGGIQKFIQRLCNSYAHYYNTKNEQKGPVFEGKFKAVRVVSAEQLLHLTRYIHLNPVTNYIVEDPSKYEYSSYNDFLEKRNSHLVNTTIIMSKFSKSDSYKEFVIDRKEYQRELKRIKHLILE